MELLHVLWDKLRFLVQQGLMIVLPMVSFGCASTPITQPVQPAAEQEASEELASEQASVEEAVEEQEDIPKLPLTAELIYYILTAEIAGQRGDTGLAVDLYAKAASIVESASLAGRSVQVAAFTRDQQRINKALKRWAEVDPDNPDVYIMQAPLLMLQKDYAAVERVINKAISLAPENTAKYLTRISDNLRELVEPNQALQLIQQLEVYQQNHIDAFFTYARLAVLHKRYQEALVNIEHVIKLDPNRQDVLVLKAQALQRMGMGEEGLAILAKAMKRKDVGQDMTFAYAKALGENGKIDEARVVFEELHEKQPRNNEIIFALGLIALESKKGEEAKKYFAELIQQGDPGKQAAYFMGLAEEANNNIEQALIWFASVPVQSGRYDSAQTRYVTILGEQGKFDEARNHLKLLRKEQPNRAVDYYLYEAAFLREHNMDQAVFDLYTEALAKNPGHTQLLYARAMVAEPLNRLSVLEEDLRFILEKDPENAPALNALGYTLTDRTDRHQEALVMIQKALEIKPGDPFYLDSLGWVYYRLGDLKNAEKYLREAIAIQSDPEFLAHLGEVLWEQRREKEAKQIWQQAIEVDDNNKLLLNIMRRYGQ